jgi:hypothetical protein
MKNRNTRSLLCFKKEKENTKLDNTTKNFVRKYVQRKEGLIPEREEKRRRGASIEVLSRRCTLLP